jgi:sarcosine oxidase subunit alpha
VKRLSAGGRIDRTRPLAFRWDGRELSGFAGDTLASALLGAGITVIGTSVSLGRPRGIMSAGFEEAHGFAQVGAGGSSEPLVRMTAVPLAAGLVAESRITKGYLPKEPDRARFEKRYAHCDVLVVGAGPAGLAATLVAKRAGVRVILVDADVELGGSLLGDPAPLDGRPADAWVAEVAHELAAGAAVRLLPRTTAQVSLDQNGMILVERVDRFAESRLWQVRARAIVLATGALERPIVFPDNDRPGVMLASAARAYLHRYALVPERGVVFTANDDGYRTALDWAAAGVSVVAVVDPRADPQGELPRLARLAGIRILAGAVVVGTAAGSDGALRAVRLGGPAERDLACDLLAVSGGFEPALNLHSQRRGAARWDESLLAVVPETPLPGQWIAGAAAGRFGLGAALDDGARTAREALQSLGVASAPWIPPAAVTAGVGRPAPLWKVAAPDGDESRSFVDLHRDVTVRGLDRALGAGLRHIEHVKRYTLIGTGVEQGRAAKLNAGALTAVGSARPIAEVGTSSARPPVEPIGFHTVGGRASGPRYEPIRTTSIQELHVAAGAVFEPVGQWLRPKAFPRAGESLDAAVLRECRAVREGVGLMDASTLGKIDVQGPDAARFLDRLYINPMASLEPGKGRYGVMCRSDGTVFDDGVVLRLDPNRFFVTTTTSNAAAVLDWMEEWLQTEWLDLRVWVGSITEQWATVAIVGPRSRDVIRLLAPTLECSNEAFPFLAHRRAPVAGIADAQVARVSFSGELAFEVSVPWTFGPALWERAQTAGQPFGITAYGLDALHILRAEKGYFIVGQETDGSTNPADLGLGRMIAKQKDFVGKRSLRLPEMLRPDRRQLVGFLPVDRVTVVPEGAPLVADPKEPHPMTALGYVTASHRSAALGRTFGLAMVTGGFGRTDTILHVVADGRATPVTITSAVLVDPEGAKRDG